MNTKFVTASVFSLISPSIVQAADVAAHEVPVHVASEVVASSPFSWGGIYFGGQVGGFSSKISAITRDVDIPLYPDEGSKSKPWIPVEKQYMPELSGFVGGFYAGVNFDLGNNFIVGIDTDMLLTEKKDTKTRFQADESSTGGPGTEGAGTEGAGTEGAGTEGAGTEGAGTEEKSRKRAMRQGRGLSRSVTEDKKEKDSLTFNHTLKQKWTGATRVRVGFSAGRVMPYIAGGVAYGQFQDILSTVITGDEPFSKTSDVTKTMIGYTLGAGVDFAMTDHLIMRAEYRYSDFGKKKFKDEIEVKYKTNDFRAGISYKF
ncbi:outer membrane protein [Bartonella grahamii]|uniref:outer membrane protein n=1 Tax=Bartonella grahamii TaxID=33045 RepID=UPI002E7B8CF4|nr:outer membrane protein [Bartonella grahamii]